jgi:hypothetical protein
VSETISSLEFESLIYERCGDLMGRDPVVKLGNADYFVPSFLQMTQYLQRIAGTINRYPYIPYVLDCEWKGFLALALGGIISAQDRARLHISTRYAVAFWWGSRPNHARLLGVDNAGVVWITEPGSTIWQLPAEMHAPINFVCG